MWLILAALHAALVSVADVLFNLIAVDSYEVTAIELGLLNAAWTLAFVVSVRTVGRVADLGSPRSAMLVSAMTFNSSLALLFLSRSLTGLAAAYCLHAVAASLVRPSVTSALTEVDLGPSWASSVKRFLSLAILLEGACLLLISRILSTNVEALTLCGPLALAALLIDSLAILLFPEVVIPLQRKVYSIERSLRSLESRAKFVELLSLFSSSPSSPFPDRLRKASRMLARGASLRSVLIGLVALRLSSELALTPLPYVLLGPARLEANEVALIYGCAKLAASLLMLIFPVISAGSLSLLAIARASAFSLLLLYGAREGDVLALSLALAAIYMLNGLADAALYASFLDNTSGYRSGLYVIVAESTNFLGSLASGYVFNEVGLLGIAVAVAALSALKAALFSRNRA
ncbi:MAG: hypothetical protein QXU52_04505 [Fervidicoccaceae archaeon]